MVMCRSTVLAIAAGLVLLAGSPSFSQADARSPIRGDQIDQREVPPAEARSAAGHPEWKAMGEAVYRTADGFLEKVTFGPASSTSSPEGDGSVESMTIVRVRTVP